MVLLITGETICRLIASETSNHDIRTGDTRKVNQDIVEVSQITTGAFGVILIASKTIL